MNRRGAQSIKSKCMLIRNIWEIIKMIKRNERELLNQHIRLYAYRWGNEEFSQSVWEKNLGIFKNFSNEAIFISGIPVEFDNTTDDEWTYFGWVSSEKTYWSELTVKWIWIFFHVKQKMCDTTMVKSTGLCERKILQIIMNWRIMLVQMLKEIVKINRTSR